jgi:hypothetical protein
MLALHIRIDLSELNSVISPDKNKSVVQLILNLKLDYSLRLVCNFRWLFASRKFEKWCWSRMEKISSTDCVENEEVHRIKKRNILLTLKRRKSNWTGYIA